MAKTAAKKVSKKPAKAPKAAPNKGGRPKKGLSQAALAQKKKDAQAYNAKREADIIEAGGRRLHLVLSAREAKWLKAAQHKHLMATDDGKLYFEGVGEKPKKMAHVLSQLLFAGIKQAEASKQSKAKQETA